MTVVLIHIFSKPFSSQLLLARVRNLIDSHRRLKQFFGDRHTLAKEDVCDMDKNFVEVTQVFT